jgi:DNA (cytosine-5)-methyltransferase 1
MFNNLQMLIENSNVEVFPPVLPLVNTVLNAGGFRHGSLFSGIGGFDLAAEWMGWENVFHCEWNEFGKKVLNHYWPQAICYDDITKTDFTPHRGTIDVLSGGFPCQPYSMAGKRLGKEDDRHLWPEMLRAIREINPTWVVGENVYGIVNWNDGLVFHEVQTDLEAEGYSVQPIVIPACAVNAPHRRDRIWFIANANGEANQRNTRKHESQSGTERLQKRHEVQQPYQPNKVRPESTRYVSNTYQRSKGSPGTSGETESNRSNYNDKQGSRRKPTQLCIRCSYVLQFNTYTTSKGLERPTRQSLQGDINGFARACKTSKYQWYVTNTNGKRYEEYEFTTKPTGAKRFNSKTDFGSQPNWNRWPAEPPICGRNDGISERLAGITVSKHRAESLKAYGNAVVPQVVFNIFKTIEAYEVVSSACI